MCKKQLRLFSCDYMIDDNENELENVTKRILT